jgi:tellurite resistance-related uncharacterized protein
MAKISGDHLAAEGALDSCPAQASEDPASRWDDERGYKPTRPEEAGAATAPPRLDDAELVQMRVRIIALENLVIALLADASDRQIEIAREMAAYIAPRPGFTPHPLTVHAAAHMIDLVDRAERLPASAIVSAPPGARSTIAPYKRPPFFDETTLPAGLRREHRTKPGVWGVIRVLEGELRYRILEPPSEVVLEPARPGIVLPNQPHCVEPIGAVRLQIEFYDQLPEV